MTFPLDKIKIVTQGELATPSEPRQRMGYQRGAAQMTTDDAGEKEWHIAQITERSRSNLLLTLSLSFILFPKPRWPRPRRRDEQRALVSTDGRWSTTD
jgi:hypothetical protein